MTTKLEEPEPRCSCWNPARSHDIDCRVHGVLAQRALARGGRDTGVTDRVASWTRDDAVEHRG